MTSGTTTTTLFPKIGDIAEQADSRNEPENEEEHDEDAADDEEKVIQEIESLCMRCEEQGVTRLMLTSIPFFREVIIMSFRCEHCGFSNNEVQSAGTIRPEGTIYTTKITNGPKKEEDLNRQVVRSGTCEIAFPELELTLPPTSRGQLTTIEGLIRDVITDLSFAQPVRRIQDVGSYERIEQIIMRLRDIVGEEEGCDDDEGEGESNKNASVEEKPMSNLTIQLDDPAGNSFIEYVDSMADPNWSLRTYHRTLEQNSALGLVDSTASGSGDDKASSSAIDEEPMRGQEGHPIEDEEVLEFPGNCSSCAHAIRTRMKKINIPHFKEVVIMSTNCEHCGYRDNEVKSGGAISEKGKRITLRCEDREDLSRDLLKSETAGLSIPEISLVLTHGTLGGRFTTVEGILEHIYEELGGEKGVFVADDSMATGQRANKMEEFLAGLKAIKNVERPFTLILDDPLSNSYVQNLYTPDPDPNMKVEMYERTFEQNEELGLNDIKVEGYEKDHSEETIAS